MFCDHIRMEWNGIDIWYEFSRIFSQVIDIIVSMNTNEFRRKKKKRNQSPDIEQDPFIQLTLFHHFIGGKIGVWNIWTLTMNCLWVIGIHLNYPDQPISREKINIRRDSISESINETANWSRIGCFIFGCAFITCYSGIALLFSSLCVFISLKWLSPRACSYLNIRLTHINIFDNIESYLRNPMLGWRVIYFRFLLISIIDSTNACEWLGCRAQTLSLWQSVGTII